MNETQQHQQDQADSNNPLAGRATGSGLALAHLLLFKTQSDCPQIFRSAADAKMPGFPGISFFSDFSGCSRASQISGVNQAPRRRLAAKPITPRPASNMA